ncbi:MAG TPA: lanthionine synthetase LanC family protein, partial [Thermoanaerobaculia bacterium]|nr:lanthionine synthetase LanC family protein [Thermoanaerobaculia bacterium]
MALTDPIVLSPEVVLVPVTELVEEVRGRLGCDAGDWAITHPRARTPSRILDARSAELLTEFRTPSRIVDAVVRFSRARGLDPETTLDEAFPLLDVLIAAGFLVEESAEEAAGIRPSLSPGEAVAGFEVLDCVQVVEDTELYQARGPEGFAALKIERRPGSGLEWEAAILKHLGGGVAPRFLDSGQRYLAMEWCPGIDAATAAAELERSDVLALCGSIATAYAGLHERGVLHGDVHPRNVLVASDGSVRLIDFGLARWDGASSALPRPGRGGIAFFYEPEYARAARAGRSRKASFAGEQFAVASLLYLLLTGTYRLDFSLGREEMLRQIAEEPPRPFAEPWPEVEAVLARALHTTPGRRFRSMADFARRLEKSPPPVLPHSLPAPAQGGRDPALGRFLSDWLERVELEGPLWTGGLQPPRASVHFGAAGIACALYRIAIAREDSRLLALADLWATRAGREEDGFDNPEMDITPESVGRVSLFHTATGPRVVQALIAHAMGNRAAQARAVAEFLAAARKPCSNPDLTLGRSGLLLAAALLLDTVRSAGLDEASLRAFGGEVLESLWRELDSLPPIPRCDERPNLGMAHGWAGYLYASLRWCRGSGMPRPDRLEERLEELANLARPWGRGLCWSWRDTADPGASYMPGWCNGSAGFVHLWTLAGSPTLAEGAAWHAWEDPDTSGNLCCGLAGRAYALLHLHRHGGGPEWL